MVGGANVQTLTFILQREYDMKTRLKDVLLAAFALALCAAPAIADDVKAGDLVISQA